VNRDSINSICRSMILSIWVCELTIDGSLVRSCRHSVENRNNEGNNSVRISVKRIDLRFVFGRIINYLGFSEGSVCSSACCYGMCCSMFVPIVLKTDWEMRFKVNLKQFIVMRSLSGTVIKNVVQVGGTGNRTSIPIIEDSRDS